MEFSNWASAAPTSASPVSYMDEGEEAGRDEPVRPEYDTDEPRRNCDVSPPAGELDGLRDVPVTDHRLGYWLETGHKADFKYRFQVLINVPITK